MILPNGNTPAAPGRAASRRDRLIIGPSAVLFIILAAQPPYGINTIIPDLWNAEQLYPFGGGGDPLVEINIKFMLKE